MGKIFGWLWGRIWTVTGLTTVTAAGVGINQEANRRQNHELYALPKQGEFLLQPVTNPPRSKPPKGEGEAEYKKEELVLDPGTGNVMVSKMHANNRERSYLLAENGIPVQVDSGLSPEQFMEQIGAAKEHVKRMDENFRNRTVAGQWIHTFRGDGSLKDERSTVDQVGDWFSKNGGTVAQIGMPVAGAAVLGIGALSTGGIGIGTALIGGLLIAGGIFSKDIIKNIGAATAARTAPAPTPGGTASPAPAAAPGAAVTPPTASPIPAPHVMLDRPEEGTRVTKETDSNPLKKAQEAARGVPKPAELALINSRTSYGAPLPTPPGKEESAVAGRDGVV